MLQTHSLRNLRGLLERPARRTRIRRQRHAPIFLTAEVQRLEARRLLSGVLTDTTPVATQNAIEGKSTGTIVLATFTDPNPPSSGAIFTPHDPRGHKHAFVNLHGLPFPRRYRDV